MTKDQLIAKQQLEIEDLKEKVSDHEKAKNAVHCLIYGCGAPLNDNYNGFTKVQMVLFARIVNVLGI